MKLTFLGTGSMVPTKQRNVVGHFLALQGEGLLIDCGEGTQRQMNLCGINRLRVNKILITHWHGDHVAGLIGLLQTIGNAENSPSIELFGPPGSKENFGHMMKSVIHGTQVNITVTELNPRGVERFGETDKYYLECTLMDHQAPTLAYSFVEKDKKRIDMDKAKKLGLKEGPLIGKLSKGKKVEVDGKTIKPEDVTYTQKGKKITFILDTALNDNCYEIAENSDLLICESTFGSEKEDLAKKYKHLTAAHAAKIAKKSKSKELILTHFSQRYPVVDELVKEAEEVFENVKAAEDFMELEI